MMLTTMAKMVATMSVATTTSFVVPSTPCGIRGIGRREGRQYAALNINPLISTQDQCALAVRLAISGVAGCALGMERRRRRGKTSVGARTMTLVAMGASLFTMVGAYGFSTGDATRLAASVATGVGFIGAGVITVKDDSSKIQVDGLTTAATVWCAAALGVASGVGLTTLVLAGTVIATFVLEARTFAYPVTVVVKFLTRPITRRRFFRSRKRIEEQRCDERPQANTTAAA